MNKVCSLCGMSDHRAHHHYKAYDERPNKQQQHQQSQQQGGGGKGKGNDPGVLITINGRPGRFRACCPAMRAARPPTVVPTRAYRLTRPLILLFSDAMMQPPLELGFQLIDEAGDDIESARPEFRIAGIKAEGCQQLLMAERAAGAQHGKIF